MSPSPIACIFILFIGNIFGSWVLVMMMASFVLFEPVAEFVCKQIDMAFHFLSMPCRQFPGLHRELELDVSPFPAQMANSCTSLSSLSVSDLCP